MSYGWLHGATHEMKNYVRRTDSAFNECHGVGPVLAETRGSDPIKATIEFIKSRHPDIPVKVIKVTFQKYLSFKCFFGHIFLFAVNFIEELFVKVLNFSCSRK